MTTLVVTHANGFLGCFTKEADGTMRQRALIDTGEQPPTPETLARVADGLAEQWGWTAPALPTAKRTKTDALPAAPKAKTKTEPKTVKLKQRSAHLISDNGHVRHPDDPPPDARPDLVLTHLRLMPYRTQREVLEGLGLEATQDRMSRWHHTFAMMQREGIIDTRKRDGTGKREWFVL